MFIGCVNYFWDIWPSHAHVLKPLTNHSGLKKHAPTPWKPIMHTAFDKMCALMVTNALAAYPNHNKQFNVNTDVSDSKLGACILPIFPHELLKSQQNYTMMEKEKLSIVATLNKL
ncbi:hypothetical protein ACHAW6_013635 [Cyclotella cf. meneghiniana]